MEITLNCINLHSNTKSSAHCAPASKTMAGPTSSKRLSFSQWEQGGWKTYLLLPLLLNSSLPHTHTHTHTLCLLFSAVRQLSGKKGFRSALSRWPPLNLGPGLSTREEHKGEQCCKFVAQSVKIPPGMLIWPVLPAHTHFNNPQPHRLKRIWLSTTAAATCVKTVHFSLSPKLPALQTKAPKYAAGFSHLLNFCD